MLIGCTGIGGSLANNNHGILIAQSASPTLLSCVGIHGTGDNGAGVGNSYGIAVAADTYSNVVMTGCVGKHPEYTKYYAYNGAVSKSRPWHAKPYQVLSLAIYVAVAQVGVTVDVGTTSGGSQIASGVDIGATGFKSFAITQMEIVSGGWIYITPSAGIPDASISVRYTYTSNYINTMGLLLFSSGHVKISNSQFLSSGASQACLIDMWSSICRDNWTISNCSFEALDPEGITESLGTGVGAIDGAPFYNCVFKGPIETGIVFASESYHRNVDLFMDVLAVSATHVRSNEDLSAATPITFTIDAQPDVPRTLSWAFDTHALITEYDMEVIGVDGKGNTVTETWDEGDGWTGETSNAFATVTSIKMTSRTGTGAGDTMDIGITDILGLSNTVYAAADVYKIKENNADLPVVGGQVDTDYDTYDLNGALAATEDFTIWFRSNLNIIS